MPVNNFCDSRAAATTTKDTKKLPNLRKEIKKKVTQLANSR